MWVLISLTNAYGSDTDTSSHGQVVGDGVFTLLGDVIPESLMEGRRGLVVNRMAGAWLSMWPVLFFVPPWV